MLRWPVTLMQRITNGHEIRIAGVKFISVIVKCPKPSGKSLSFARKMIPPPLLLPLLPLDRFLTLEVHLNSPTTWLCRFRPSISNQRWAPGAYNPRALGASLGISGHRTDLEQEVSEPDRDRAHTERELTYAGSRTGRVE